MASVKPDKPGALLSACGSRVRGQGCRVDGVQQGGRGALSPHRKAAQGAGARRLDSGRLGWGLAERRRPRKPRTR